MNHNAGIYIICYCECCRLRIITEVVCVFGHKMLINERSRNRRDRKRYLTCDTVIKMHYEINWNTYFMTSFQEKIPFSEKQLNPTIKTLIMINAVLINFQLLFYLQKNHSRKPGLDMTFRYVTSFLCTLPKIIFYRLQIFLNLVIPIQFFLLFFYPILISFPWYSSGSSSVWLRIIEKPLWMRHWTYGSHKSLR